MFIWYHLLNSEKLRRASQVGIPGWVFKKKKLLLFFIGQMLGITSYDLQFSTLTFTFYVRLLFPTMSRKSGRTCVFLSCSNNSSKLHLWEKNECKIQALYPICTIYYTQASLISVCSQHSKHMLTVKYSVKCMSLHNSDSVERNYIWIIFFM